MTEGKSRILVVDDEQDICDILSFNIKTAGYDVMTVNSGEEAIEKIRRATDKPFDLILLDVMMGGMSGFEMAQILKSDPATADIAIIFLTVIVVGFISVYWPQHWSRRLHLEALLASGSHAAHKSRIATD